MWIRENNLILGGDLNFSLGASEVWGHRASPDSLINLFLNFLDQVGLVDVETKKPTPTWCKRRVGVDHVAKHLNKFLLAEEFLDSFDLVRQWVAYGGESDHFPIMLDLRERNRRVLRPFKFFEGWISDPSFQELVRGLCLPIVEGN